MPCVAGGEPFLEREHLSVVPLEFCECDQPFHFAWALPAIGLNAAVDHAEQPPLELRPAVPIENPRQAGEAPDVPKPPRDRQDLVEEAVQVPARARCDEASRVRANDLAEVNRDRVFRSAVIPENVGVFPSILQQVQQQPVAGHFLPVLARSRERQDVLREIGKELDPLLELVSFILLVEPTIPLVFIRPGLVRTLAGRPAERLDLLEDVRRAKCCGRLARKPSREMAGGPPFLLVIRQGRDPLGQELGESFNAELPQFVPSHRPPRYPRVLPSHCSRPRANRSPGPPRRRGRRLKLLRREPFQHRVPQTLVAKRVPTLALLGPSCNHVLESAKGATAIQSHFKKFPKPRILNRSGKLDHPIIFLVRLQRFDEKQPTFRKTCVDRLFAQNVFAVTRCIFVERRRRWNEVYLPRPQI